MKNIKQIVENEENQEKHRQRQRPIQRQSQLANRRAYTRTTYFKKFEDVFDSDFE